MSGERRFAPTTPAGRANGEAGGFLAAAYGEIALIEFALRRGRPAVIAAAAERLARAGGPAGAARVAAIAADLQARALAGDLTIAAHLVASLEEALMAACAPAPQRRTPPAPLLPVPFGAAAAPAAAAAAPPCGCRGVTVAVAAAEPGDGEGTGPRPAAMVAAALLGFAVLIARAFSPGHVGGAIAAAAVALAAAALAALGRSASDSARRASALRRSRERLLAGERRQRLLFERSPQPIWAYDRATLRIVAVSDAALAAYGYSRDEFLALTIDALNADEDAESPVRHRSRVAGDGLPGTTSSRPARHRRKDGTMVDVEIASDDLVLDGRECRIVLSRDITEHNAATIELADAHAAAVEASSMKSAFLANLSHEIRTPMNGVIGMNELLLATELDEEQRYLAEQVAGSSRQMVAIIDDILDISKIEAGRFELHEAEFELERLVADVCRAWRGDAAAKGLALTHAIDDGVPGFVHGDAERIRRVLASLVSNAVKFTPAGSIAVRVAAGGTPPLLRLEVADTGVGVDARSVGRIFEPFTQADMSSTRCYGGAGLGLAIARDLTRLMGGTIGVRSVAGHGSAFWFELPLEPVGTPRLRTDEPSPRAAWLHDGGAAPLVLVPAAGPAVVVRRHSGSLRGGRERRARSGRGRVAERPGALGRFGRALAEAAADYGGGASADRA